MFITVPFQVRSITYVLQPFQSGSVFTSALSLASALYELHYMTDRRRTEKIRPGPFCIRRANPFPSECRFQNVKIKNIFHIF